MQDVIRLVPFALIAASLGALRQVVARCIRAWRHAAARREMAHVDEATFRDLGISPSEFDSFWSEAHGDAEWTRLRVRVPVAPDAWR